MTYPYKCTLVIGATSGIGASLANTILRETSGKVIGAGRRKERLDKWMQEHGKDRVSGEVVDLTNLGSLEGFAKKVIQDHPDLDSVILNSGISNSLDFAKPESISINEVDMELTTNYISYIHLLKHFLPHLQANKRPSCIVTVSSGLAIIPYPQGPTYSATKAALHHLTMVLRSQMKSSGFDHIRVVEILPPLVQTELSSATGPQDTSAGMPLAEFTAETWKALSSGAEHVPVGMTKGWWSYIEERRLKAYDHFVGMMSGKKAPPPWEGAGP